jgi:pimeloyl-ACP methyl ester carboxylesterase
MWAGAHYGGAVSATVGGWFTDQLWFTPWTVELSERARQREAQWLAPTTPLRVPFGGSHLSGFMAGDGPAVLLVHGWGDRASRLGAFIEPLTAAGHRVVAIDAPAHGDSPRRMTNAYEAADALRAAAAHVGGVDAVIAHSMGGLEALLAIRGGLQVQRLVLLASAVRLEHAMDKFSTLFAIPERSMQGLQRRIERRFGPGIFDDLAADRLIGDIDVPGVLIHDRQDPQVDFADGQELAAAWPGGRLIPTEGLGHDRLLRDPDVIRTAVGVATTASRLDDRAATPAG